jgi:hypothetical protein
MHNPSGTPPIYPRLFRAWFQILLPLLCLVVVLFLYLLYNHPVLQQPSLCQSLPVLLCHFLVVFLLFVHLLFLHVYHRQSLLLFIVLLPVALYCFFVPILFRPNASTFKIDVRLCFLQSSIVSVFNSIYLLSFSSTNVSCFPFIISNRFTFT